MYRRIRRRCVRRLHDPTRVWPRYTLAKFRGYLQYADQTSHWRHWCVLLVSPLPSLATSLLAPLVSLQDPQLGLRANTGFLASFFVSFAVVAAGSTFQIHASSGLTRRDVSVASVLAIALLTALLTTAAFGALATLWRFPVPFATTFIFAPFMVLLVGAHVIVLWRALLRHDSTLRGPLWAFVVPFIVQASQVVVYPAFSAAFAATHATAQVALVLLFPFIKFGFRALKRRLTRHLPDDGNESAVSGVEIAAAMYQTILMQTAASPYATVLLLAIDLLQGMLAIIWFMAKASDIAQQEIVDHASRLVGATEPMLTGQATPLRPPRHVSVVPHAATVVPLPTNKSNAVGVDQLPVVAHALELLHTAESLVLIEYFEVVLPAVNAIFLCLATQLESAEYSPKLRLYRHRPAELDRALLSLLLYTSLQALSLVVMHAVIWRRYRVCTITLLAYLLERHAWALQGKLIAWLGIMFQLPVLHYGVDFTFRFEWRLPPLE